MTSSSRTWAVLIDGKIQIRNTLGGDSNGRKVKVLKEQFAHFLGYSFTHLVSLMSFKCRNPVSSSLSPWLRACAWNIVGPSDYVMGARVKCCMEKQLTMRILKLSGL